MHPQHLLEVWFALALWWCMAGMAAVATAEGSNRARWSSKGRKGTRLAEEGLAGEEEEGGGEVEVV